MSIARKRIYQASLNQSTSSSNGAPTSSIGGPTPGSGGAETASGAGNRSIPLSTPNGEDLDPSIGVKKVTANHCTPTKDPTSNSTVSTPGGNGGDDEEEDMEEGEESGAESDGGLEDLHEVKDKWGVEMLAK